MVLLPNLSVLPLESWGVCPFVVSCWNVTGLAPDHLQENELGFFLGSFFVCFCMTGCFECLCCEKDMGKEGGTVEHDK